MPFPIDKTETKPILSRLRWLFEPTKSQKPQNPPAEKTDPKTQNFCLHPLSRKKKLRFLEKKLALALAFCFSWF